MKNWKSLGILTYLAGKVGEFHVWT